MNFQPKTNLNFKKFPSARRGSAFPVVSAFQVSGSGSRAGVSGLPGCGGFLAGASGFLRGSNIAQSRPRGAGFSEFRSAFSQLFGELEVRCGHALGGLS